MQSYLSLFVSVVILAIFQNCNMTKDNTMYLHNIIQADCDFSKMSAEKGRNAAFISFCANDAVMLIPNSLPIKGKNKIKELLLRKSDTSYTLIWNPEYGAITESGELGYTYGIWEFNTTNSEGESILEKGTYCTIWKKDYNGKWKWVLDTGNDGLGEIKN